MPSETYNVGCYLLDRLAEIGLKHLLGVPGDYNLRFLDDVEAHPSLKWIGCANELNAAYAADGYARCRGFAALLTTYGVGELSALNGIAGAYAESSPVLHLVGGPKTTVAAAKKVVHHTLGDGDFNNFSKMSEHISVATARLTKENAASEIDRVLGEILFSRKPGFILLPDDVAIEEIPPPAHPLCVRQLSISEESLRQFTVAIEEKFSKAKNPAVLVGYLCDRFNCNEATQRLVDEAHIPFAAMMLGKAALNEQSPMYAGTYHGGTSVASVKRVIEEADVCVQVGVKFHDFGSGHLTQKIEEANTIDIQPFEATVAGKVYGEVPMAKAVEAVHAAAAKHCASWATPPLKPPAFTDPKDPATFGGSHLWQEIQAGLAPGDIVCVDQGTVTLSMPGLRCPEGCTFIFQCLWGSIGFALPAAFGAALAEPHRRVVLIVGDGAALMTAQELGTFMRNDLKPVVLLLNNRDYVVERMLHGWDADYNCIALWNWSKVVEGMTVQAPPATRRVTSGGEILKVLKETQADRSQMHFLEVILPDRELPAPYADA